MNYNSKKFRLIERYFDEDLSKDELDFFEAELERDEKFKTEVQRYEFVFGGLKEVRARKLKEKFANFEDQIHTRELKVDIGRKRIITSFISIAIIGLAMFVVDWPFSSSNVDLNTVFQEYFKPYPNVIAPATRSSESDNTALFRAMHLYDSALYDEAIIEFNDMVVTSELKNEILFYKSVSLLANGEANEALVHFELMDQVSSFDNQRKWYTALTFLQLGELKLAKKKLKEIVSDQSYFIVYAEEVLALIAPQE